VRVLEKIQAVNDRREAAHRCGAFARRVFRFAIGRGEATVNPAAEPFSDVLKPVETEHHAAIVDPAKVGALLRAIDGYDGQPLVVLALRLAPLVALRPGELRGAQWPEIDLDGATWVIPAERMKGGREPHTVPLSRQAVALLKNAQAISWMEGHVFPNDMAGNRCLSDNTLTAALRRLGYSGDQQTVHGFRTIFSTLLNERGVDPQLIELQLAHQDQNKVRAAYNRAERLPERRAMMQEWADHLDSLRAG
jgi:integrase